jgi:hypothetical protein
MRGWFNRTSNLFNLFNLFNLHASDPQKSYPIHTLNCGRRNSWLPPTEA